MEADFEYLRRNAKSMCRTCYEISLHLHPLHEETEQFPLKSLADLLFDVARIEIKQVANEDVLPTHLCGNCSRKLKNAYKFVQRAHEINIKLMQYSQMLKGTNSIEIINGPKQLDCLLEAPIDIPSNAVDFLKIKMETDCAEEAFFESFPSVVTPENKEINLRDSLGGKEMKEFIDNFDEEDDCSLANIKNKNLSENIQLKSEVSIYESVPQDSKDPIRTIRTRRMTSLESDYQDDCCNDTDSDWSDIPRQQRRRCGRRNSKRKDRYSCKECNTTFAWKKDLTRHSLNHDPNPPHKCKLCDRSFTRRDKLNDHIKAHQRKTEILGRRTQRHPEWKFAERLFSRKKFQRIQCMLCNNKFESTHILRLHLRTHAEESTLHIINMESEVIRTLCSQTDQNLDELKTQICRDVKAQRFGKFYDIVNEHGYELSISDSDGDVDADSETLNNKYTCELCAETFSRKFAIFEHLKEKHTEDRIPYKCNVCKVDFVSREMFEAHTRTQCRNKEKKYQCLTCPGKFMWVRNLDNHNCSNRFNNSEYKNREIVQCNVCDEIFGSRKDLRRHKETHDLHDDTSQKCKICFERFFKADNLRLHCKQVHAFLLRRIECCLCGEQFKLIKHLREHLSQHSDGITGIKNKNSLFFKTFAPQMCSNEQGEHDTASAAQLAELICKDYALQNMSRFYLAVDESGNELDLFDSESDLETETANSARLDIVYKCEICLQEFNRRKRILLHQYAEHKNLIILPHRCEHCAMQFVCAELLRNHITTNCSNIYKKWICSNCPSRFVWQENLENHTKIKHAEPEQQIIRKLANKLQCDECDKTFIWPKDLNRHRRCHLPDDEKYECPLCPRRFNRKDNMQAHIKIHGAVENVTGPLKKEFVRFGKQPRTKAVDENLCKPNGCKVIQCMICLSRHTKISDLRTHLRTHQYVVSFDQRGRDEEAIGEISKQLYPDEEPMKQEEILIKRIITDITQHQWDRFYSITNEVGYELNLSDSETESDSDEERETTRNSYSCDLCAKAFDRKYMLFEHQKYMHAWLDLPHVCDVCEARFSSERLLQNHCREHCKNYQKRFACRKCSMKFMWNDNFKNHERSLHPEKSVQKKKLKVDRYECLECHRTFAWQKDLNRHLVQHQPEAKNFRCFWCPRRFFRKDKLYVHIKRHDVTPQCLAAAESYSRASSEPNGQKEIFCKICNMSFSTITSLRSHIRECSYEIKLPSLGGALKIESPRAAHYSYDSLLNYSITNQLGFELHLDDSETEGEGAVMLPKSESIPLKYTCELCGMEFIRKYEVARHLVSNHPNEKMPRKCEKCCFRTVSKDILDHHMRTQCYNTEKQLQCRVCLLKFMWQENLSRHIKYLHMREMAQNKQSVEEAVEGEENPSKSKLKRSFQCDLCKCKYNRKDRLTAHIKKAHTKGQDSKKTNAQTSHIDPTTGEPMPKPQLEKKFLCAFCGRAVTSSSNLIIHMRRHTGEKPFKCDFCDMAFPRSSDLQCHRRTHTGEKPHKCTVCDKAFSRSYKLQTHMRIHSGERPYKCTYCEKSFTQSNDLTLHIRRHTGERPYVCGICGERFIQGTALKNHRTMRGHFEDIEPRKLTILEQF